MGTITQERSDGAEIMATVSETAPVVKVDRLVKVTRRRVDTVLIWLGVVTTAVLVIAGALLQWGSNFAEGRVSDELSAQSISFPSEDSLVAQGRNDLVEFADQQVSTGDHAEAYASFIAGHLEGIGNGMTFSELGGPEQAANTALAEAIDSDSAADEIAALEAEAATITAQRDTVFKGEMLRGALLTTYAWSVIGQIAGIAAVVAFLAAALMFVLVVTGQFHLRKVPR